ncbi:MAG TPA: hypothetical protein PLL69_12800, partial [Gemmatimonadales bacterium]|nr:hypothetical protein [Gemmatimonadales bacterium]
MMVRSLAVRLFAAAMLVASPAIGGQVLPLLHPCPVAEEAAGHQHSGHDSESPSPGSGHCICIGSCAASALAAAPESATLAFKPQVPRQPAMGAAQNRDLAPAHQPPL